MAKMTQREKDLAVARAMVEKEAEENIIFSEESAEEKAKRLKELAQRKRVTQQLQSGKDGTSMEELMPSKPKSEQPKSSQTSSGVRVAQGMASASKSSSVSPSAPPASGETQALNSAMQAGLATGGDPMAMAGAAFIGLLQAEEQKKAYRAKKLEEAKLREAEGKESESKIYQQLAQGMRGILG